MNEQQLLIRNTLERLLGDLCTPEVVNAAEQGEWPRELWAALVETGLALAGIPEAVGGAGGEPEDSLLVIREAAKFAAPLPLAEHFMAAHLLGEAGGSVSEWPMTIARGDFELGDDLTLVGRADNVAFLHWCGSLVIPARSVSGMKLCTLAVSDASVTRRRNMAGEPRDSVVVNKKLDAAQVLAAADDVERRVHLMGAAIRGLMMAGALESVLEMSVQYSLERSQFGRPISRFQAIQQQLAVMAGEVAASSMAGHAIARAFVELDEVEIGIGKARIGEAVQVCTDIAHQVHGAMGYTRAHTLNHRTRRLWCWRDEYGNEKAWQLLVGRKFLAEDVNPWDGITRRR